MANVQAETLREIVTPEIVVDSQGTALIAGTTTKVIEIVLNREWTGQTPEELAQELPHLSLPQVQAALAYYEEHREELDAEIERRRQLVERLRAEAGPSPIAERLRAKRKSA